VKLPDGYSLRRPTLGDAASAAAVMTAADDRAEEITSDDVAREWYGLDLETDIWLLETNGALAATALLLKRGEDHVASECFVHPEHAGRGVGSALLALIEGRARELAPGGRLTNGVLASNQAAVDLLERNNYRPVRHFFRMAVELKEPPPEPQWPAGLEPRAFGRGHVERFHAASEEAFAEEWGRSPRTLEQFLRDRVDAPGASLNLWLGVWEGDEIVATLICDARRYGMGWIASIGVRPAWRRRGLGLALLHHAFGEFWRRGERTIGLGVDAENPTGATRLYERAGMHAVFDAVVYEKQLGV
jgi:mycothiol synthase